VRDEDSWGTVPLGASTLALLSDWQNSCPLPKPNILACAHRLHSAPGSLVRRPRHRARNPPPIPDSLPSSSAAVVPRAHSACVSSAGSSVRPRDRSDAVSCDSLVLRSGTTAHAIAVPEARLLPCQFHPLGPQRFIRTPGLIAIARYRQRHQAARSALAEGMILLHLLDSGLERYELQTGTMHP